MKKFLVLAVGIVAAAICVRLGLWQLSRLQEQSELNLLLNDRLSRPPILLGSEIPEEALHFRRALASGTFDLERQVVMVGRSRRGSPGVWVVTPLVMNGSAVLVERGFVASADAKAVDLGDVDEPAPVQVRGVLLEREESGHSLSAEGEWPLFLRTAIPRELEPLYPYDLLPVVLRRVEAHSLPSGLREIPMPDLDRGPHLSYAIQWFAFGLIAVVGSSILAFGQRRKKIEGDSELVIPEARAMSGKGKRRMT